MSEWTKDTLRIARRDWFYLVSQAAAVVWWFWWLPSEHLPLPGFAVAIVAGVAALMSVHTDPRPWQKFVYLVLIGGFLATEFRAISKDHTNNDATQKAFFDAQKEGFRQIAAQAQTNFSGTAGGLTEAINGLNKNLSVASKTLQQTEPRAELHSTWAEFQNAPTNESILGTGDSYEIDFHYSNDQPNPAKLLKHLEKVYVAKPGDLEEQKRLKETFEKEWSNYSSDFKPSLVPGSYNRTFWTYTWKPTLGDAQKLKQGNTVYFVQRLQYKDKSGVWNSDLCMYNDTHNKHISIGTLISCSVLMNDRYRP